jgi:hypothetical protein
MTRDEAEQWRQALDGYRYPIKGASEILFRFRFRLAQQWFSFELGRGDREETIQFEARFREFAPRSLEAWYEGIFWKLVVNDGKRGEYLAGVLIENLRSIGYRAPDIWKAGCDFVESGGRKEFKTLQDQLFLTSGGIPVAATFPALMCPERFPMADRWIAKWVCRYCDENPAEAQGRGLITPSEAFLRHKKTTLTIVADWQFYVNWIEWCRTSAKLLAELTAFPWRARDVEMAVFTNARSGQKLLPPII